ncbi:uncharacterized protein LOC141548327 isoform X2 [Sminthopsis crassicaudata]|uniref:uncharacterized protein LOC141548327 isoform X2 n=1 Tax=Sminthopsis crassicaudata TaxID=9301 RepID=UPI003D696EFB
MRAVLGLCGLSLLVSCAAGSVFWETRDGPARGEPPWPVHTLPSLSLSARPFKTERKQAGNEFPRVSSPWYSKQDWDLLRRPRNWQVADGGEEVPWLVSVARLCQGVVLDHWRVLSTARCLRNTNPALLRVRSSGTWLNGSEICLHPTFVPPARTAAAKSDLGVLFLRQPARLAGGQLPLARDASKAQENCPFCGHRPCHVYQRQSTQEPGLMRATRTTVRLLGPWACHRSGADAPATETFCIQMHPWPGPDCQVQPGSPVLCRFGNRRELVGLVSEPGKACSAPVPAVRTAPYRGWLDAVVQAARKRPPSLPCMLSPPSSPHSHPQVHPTPYSALEEADGGAGSVQARGPFLVTSSPGGPAKTGRRPSRTRLPLATAWGLPEASVGSPVLPPGAPPAAKTGTPTPSARSSAGEPREGAPTSRFRPRPPQPIRDPALGRLAGDRGAAQQGAQTSGSEPQAAVGIARAPAPLGPAEVGNPARPESRLLTEAAGVWTPPEARPSGGPKAALPGPRMPRPATGRSQRIPWPQNVQPAAGGLRTPWPTSREPQWIPQAQIPPPATRGSLTPRPASRGPLTFQPASRGPLTFHPATGRLLTPRPATRGSLTFQPASRGPLTFHPATGRLLTPRPATRGSLTFQPASRGPLTFHPATGRLLTPRPATRGSLTFQPASRGPLTFHPATGRLLTPRPATRGSLTFQPATGRPLTPRPATRGSLTPRPATRGPLTFQPATGRLLTSRPATRGSLTFQPATRRSLTPRPATGRPLTPWPATRRSLTPRPQIPRPLTPRPLTPQPATRGSLTPRPQIPRPLTPQPATRGSLTPQRAVRGPQTSWPATRRPLTPRPQIPRPQIPRPLTPRPATRGPLTPRPLTPRPATRGPLTPRPLTPRPVTPRPAALTVAPWARSPMAWPFASQPHPAADAGGPQSPAAVRSQTHSAPDDMGAWLLPFQTVPAVLLQSHMAGPWVQLARAPAGPWIAPNSEAAWPLAEPAPETAGPWALQMPAAGQLPGRAPSAAGPWALAETGEGGPGAHLAAPLPWPVAEAAGFWPVPTPAVKAIVPWPGPMSKMASEAIVPWAGPAPPMVQGLDLRNLPGTASGGRLPPSPALFSGSLAYHGPFLSPVLSPLPQSLPPAPAHSQPSLFSGALQALAWGPPGPAVPKSQPGGDSEAGPSGTEGRPAPSPLPSSAPVSSPAGPSRSRSPVPDLHHQPQREQLPLRVTLAQCRLGLGWRSSFQAYWLFQTALSSEQGLAKCGMRPGFVARCPTCWEAEEGEFPWVVSLQFSLSHFCSGSILNEWWVLTTASCANFIRNSEALAQVQAGVTDLEDQVRAQLVGIHRVLPYFGLKGPTGLGLIQLKEPLRFQPRALAVCLEESSKRTVTKPRRHLSDCWVPGWTLIKGNLVTMQKRRLDVVEVSNCAHFWPIESSTAFCVEAKKVMGQSSCKGDLGAPLMCRPKSHLEETPWVQMGVLTAFDETCTRPYVFSRIHPFDLWLRASTKSQHPPWVRTVPRPTLSSLLQPEALVNRISLRFAMPWQALIVTCDSRLCGGSVLSPSWILTSAHCIRNMSTENMAVFLGLPQPGGNMTVAHVSSVVLHERYQSVDGVPWNDLALLLLQKPLSSSQPLAPVGHVDDVNKAECWLTGPRELREGETDQNPQALHVQVKDGLSCARRLPGSVRNSVLCLGPWVPEFQVALDLMGPGSALLCRSRAKNGTWRQTGLTSIRSLTFLLAPYFPWISKTTSVQADHRGLNQSVGKSIPVTSAAGAEPRGPRGLLFLLTLWLRFLRA